MNCIKYNQIDDEDLYMTINNIYKILNIDNIIICDGQKSNDTLVKEYNQLGLKNINMIGGDYKSKNLYAQFVIATGEKLRISI